VLRRPATIRPSTHATGSLVRSHPSPERLPAWIAKLSHHRRRLAPILEIELNGFHAIFQRIHGHPSLSLATSPGFCPHPHRANQNGTHPEHHARHWSPAPSGAGRDNSDISQPTAH